MIMLTYLNKSQREYYIIEVFYSVIPSLPFRGFNILHSSKNTYFHLIIGLIGNIFLNNFISVNPNLKKSICLVTLNHIDFTMRSFIDKHSETIWLTFIGLRRKIFSHAVSCTCTQTDLWSFSIVPLHFLYNAETFR